VAYQQSTRRHEEGIQPVNGTGADHLFMILLALKCESERRELNTVKIGISASHIMVDSFHNTDKYIAFGKSGQDVVN
jgi:hypothetical protein